MSLQKSKWEYNVEFDWFYCTECGTVIKASVFKRISFIYCPGCGTKMIDMR